MAGIIRKIGRSLVFSLLLATLTIGSYFINCSLSSRTQKKHSIETTVYSHDRTSLPQKILDEDASHQDFEHHGKFALPAMIPSSDSDEDLNSNQEKTPSQRLTSSSDLKNPELMWFMKGYVLPEIIRDYVISHKQEPLELLVQLAENNKTLLVGESHSNTAAKKFIADSLETLANKGGIKYLAVEIDHKFQSYIDAYLSGKISASKLRKRISYIDNACSLYMMDKAKEAGMKVIAIDSQKAGFNRDKSMYEKVLRILEQDPKAKVLVYIGRRHVYEGRSGSSNLQSLGCYLEENSSVKSSAIGTVFPERVSEVIKVKNIPKGVGFTTDQFPLKDMVFDSDSSELQSLNVYYGKDLDAIIIPPEK